MRNLVHSKPPQEYTQVFGPDREKSVNEIMIEMIKQKQDAGRLVETLMSYRVLEVSIMQPCHKILNSLVVVAKEIDRKEKVKKDLKNTEFLLGEGVKMSEKQMSFEQAYNEVKKLEEQYSLEGRQGFSRSLNLHYLDILRPHFDESKEIFTEEIIEEDSRTRDKMAPAMLFNPDKNNAKSNSVQPIVKKIQSKGVRKVKNKRFETANKIQNSEIMKHPTGELDNNQEKKKKIN